MRNFGTIPEMRRGKNGFSNIFGGSFHPHEVPKKFVHTGLEIDFFIRQLTEKFWSPDRKFCRQLILSITYTKARFHT